MVTYKEAVSFVKEHKGQVRCVIISSEHCVACTMVTNVLKNSGLPFVEMDSEDPEFIFKPSNFPQTAIFSKENICYSRYDIFDLNHLNSMLADIERWETVKSRKAA